MNPLRIFNSAPGEKKFFLSFGVFFLGVLASYAVFAQSPVPAQEGGGAGGLTAAGIRFPVPELGNCKNKEDCRTYCNEPAHMPACIAFSENHGLVNKEEAVLAKKFANRILAGNGPGGCTSPESCKNFCGTVKNIGECLAFAEKQGIQGEHFEEAKKLKTYLESGGSLPGGCTSRESCESYCRDFSHAEECFAFAEKAKIAPASAPGQIGRGEPGPRPEEIRKFLELAKRNETPGGCTSKESCESYCRDEKYFNECIAFGERAGFIPKEDAALLKGTGGKGPGGCDSEEACYSYCNEPAHQQECVAFAEEHRVISPDGVKEVKNAWIRLRQGFENAPQEVAECLKASVGENIIQDIQSGKLVPGPAIGDRVKACFEKFGDHPNPQRPFQNVPPEIAGCLKDKFGTDFDAVRTGKKELTPESADVFRVCFETQRLFAGEDERLPATPPVDRVREFLRSAPSSVLACLKEKFGTDFSAESPEKFLRLPEAGGRMKDCFDEFRLRQSIPVPEKPQALPMPPLTGLGNISPALLECLKENMNPEVLSNIMRGAQAPPEFTELVKKCALQIRNASGTIPQLELPPIQKPACIQVITPARDPASGTCREFPTPCDVPQNWYKVERCYSSQDPSGGGSTGEVVPQPSYMYPTYSAPPATNDVLICSDYESCKRVCTDASNPYFGSVKCTEFRKSLIQPTSQVNFSLFRLLGAIFLPFLGSGR